MLSVAWSAYSLAPFDLSQAQHIGMRNEMFDTRTFPRVSSVVQYTLREDISMSMMGKR